ncbi:hypothetical protein [Streptomyces hydrogenans]|uniref:hypothetical protein n=1 Tax=Streptomyces hydrogenans TaxID=1873719 RepID=UPI00382DF945
MSFTSSAAASAQAMAGVALGCDALGVCFAGGGLGAVGVDLVGLGPCLQGLDSLLLGVGLSSNTGGFLGRGFGRYETDAGTREIDQRSGCVVVPLVQGAVHALDRGTRHVEARTIGVAFDAVGGRYAAAPARWTPEAGRRAGVSR